MNLKTTILLLILALPLGAKEMPVDLPTTLTLFLVPCVYSVVKSKIAPSDA